MYRFSSTKNLIPEINKTIFKFLWNNKNPEPIARETLFLPREREREAALEYWFHL